MQPPFTYLAAVKDSTDCWLAQPPFHFHILRSFFYFNGVSEASPSFIRVAALIDVCITNKGPY